MNVLIIGGGGREHALAWKIAQSPQKPQVFVAPGNAGTQEVGKNVALDPGNPAEILGFVAEQAIDLVIIGPEQPLVEGLADLLRQEDILVVGPGAKGAQLEGSKDFSKAFMTRHGIPTAAYGSFSSGELEAALAFIDRQKLPVVVKASGLAAGKGVLICQSHEEARQATRDMLEGSAFGSAGQTVVIEEFLTGIEVSVFILTDGQDYLLLPSAKDYKRIGEGDTGLNTGGMGAVSPVPFADAHFMQMVERSIIRPTLKGLQEEDIPFRGFIFIGLMVVDGKPYVLEYNVRMGDPETEVVLPRLKSDLLPLCLATARGQLSDHQIEIDPQTCCTVMLVSGGYPGSYPKGLPITGLDQIEGALVFHAGTRADSRGQILTNGGRVLAVSAIADDLSQALSKARENVEKINFDGRYYRRDIGHDLLALDPDY